MTNTRPTEQFEEYLNTLGLRFTREAPIGSHRPDFLVHSAIGDVLCHVMDMERSDQHHFPLDATACGGDQTAGSLKLPLDSIQLCILAFNNQLGEYNNRYPCLVVLFDAHRVFDDRDVLSAMYGMVIKGAIQHDEKRDESDPSFGFGREGGYLTRMSNTTLSALAFLEYVRPNSSLVRQAMEQQDFGQGSERIPRMVAFHHELRAHHPEMFVSVPRLRVFRNVFAAVPWPGAALKGPLDLLWPSEDSR